MGRQDQGGLLELRYVMEVFKSFRKVHYREVPGVYYSNYYPSNHQDTLIEYYKIAS